MGLEIVTEFYGVPEEVKTASQRSHGQGESRLTDTSLSILIHDFPSSINYMLHTRRGTPQMEFIY